MEQQKTRRGEHQTERVLVFLREHESGITQFAFLLVFVAIIFAMTFLAMNSFNVETYAFMILSVALVLFLVKRLIASFFEIRLTNKNWTAGLIFSVVATLFLSSFGIPVLAPILNTTEYHRANTLRGMKKGDVNLHEKWDIVMFSSIAVLAFSMLFFWLNTILNSQPVFDAGAFLATYTFLNLVPYQKFDGAFLAYHNTIISIVFLLLALLTVIASYISFWAGFGVFIAFAIFGFVSYRLKLW